MIRVMVLGSAAGGGLPQWNCGCAGCSAARLDPALQNGQVSLAVSADDTHWFLINASPDLRQQLTATPALHPQALRHSPIAGVILTNGEVDAVAGLLSLREGSPFRLYAHPDVLEVLAQNSIFNVLNQGLVPRLPMPLDVPIDLELPDGSPSGLSVEAFAVPGKPAWYMEGAASREGDTIGLHLRGGGQSLFLLPACGAMTPELAARLTGADLVFFDGTLWTDDEMIRAGLSHKTGQSMGHMAITGPDGVIASLATLRIGRKVFVHINNSNPVLLPGSPERQEAERAGWCVALPGMEFTA